jgi:hypothetical protein
MKKIESVNARDPEMVRNRMEEVIGPYNPSGDPANRDECAFFFEYFLGFCRYLKEANAGARANRQKL